jgi:hypothetical protein
VLENKLIEAGMPKLKICRFDGHLHARWPTIKEVNPQVVSCAFLGSSGASLATRGKRPSCDSASFNVVVKKWDLGNIGDPWG